MNAGPSVHVVRPQPGPQETFVSIPADITIYGGSAGGGKSHGLMLAPLNFVDTPGFKAMIFRRKAVELSQPGGLRDAAASLYAPYPGSTVRNGPPLEWEFPAGAEIHFSHIEHEKDIYGRQGLQAAMIGFDELTAFTAKQFWYLLSRNRSMCGVRPFMLATCNPDADSWVAELIAWWIDEETGFPIKERSGILRYFVRVNDTLMWADSPEGLAQYTDDRGEPIPPKSLTFIPAQLDDNPKLMEADPGYRANLMALNTVERERLLKGNWKIRPAAGLYFQRGWVTVEDAAPANIMWVRGWDLAATPEREGTDPDWTCGTLMGIEPNGHIWVKDHIWDRLSPGGVEKLLLSTAKDDGPNVSISIPQDPAQAGKAQKYSLTRLLSAYDVRSRPVTGDKVTRFSPFSAQCEAGHVSVVRGPWNDRWFRELENFPPDGDTGHDDDADSTSEAYGFLMRQKDMGSIALTVPELVSYN